MLKPINQVSNRVAEGRRMASRSIVLTSLSSIACVAYRRSVIGAEEGKTRAETIYEDGILLSEHGEHAIKYDDLGYVMLLLDKFTGGSIHSDGEDINSGEAVFYAQIEPFNYDDYGKTRQMLLSIPDWKPTKGDIFAMVVSESLIKWVEVVGVTGQSMHSHYGERYILNVRDKLMHLEPFISQEDVLKPEVSIYPKPLSEIKYSTAPFFDVIENDPNTSIDNEIVPRVFKLIDIQDEQLFHYHDIADIVQLNKRTNSHYYFTQDDAVIVDKSLGEVFKLTSGKNVNAVEVSTGYITKILIMIDNAVVVDLITENLKKDRAVTVEKNGEEFFEFTPKYFDEVRSAYHFIVDVDIGSIQSFELVFTNGQRYLFSIDAVDLEVAE